MTTPASCKKRNPARKATLAALPFLLPGFLLFLAFILVPLFFNLRLSVSDYRIADGTLRFVGFENYRSMLTDQSGRFWYAYRNNLLYALVTTPCILLFGMVSAVLVNAVNRGKVFFRTVFYLPVITSWVIVGLVFLYLFNANRYGLVNHLLVDVFHVMPKYVSWLQKEWSGNFVIWVMGIWKNIGWCMLIYLAALQGIPGELYEAASIEGAGAFHKYVHITIPLLRPTTFFLVVNLIIGSFNVFIQVLLLTNGGPNGRTSVLQYLLYDRSFNLFRFGEGAAIGVVTGLTVYLLTVLLQRLTREDRQEGDSRG